MNKRMNKRMYKMRDVYVLVIDQNNMGDPEDLSSVVSYDLESLIDYVVNEELPEQGYDEGDIEEMGVAEALRSELYWEDPDGVKYIINESKMI